MTFFVVQTQPDTGSNPLSHREDPLLSLAESDIPEKVSASKPVVLSGYGPQMTQTRFTSLAAAILALPLSSLHGAATASDNAGNYNPNANYGGLNNGTGFAAFVVGGADPTNNTANSFLNTSNNNGFGDGNIDTNNLSFGLFANNGSLLTVNRSFLADALGQTALTAGQTFSLSFDNGFVTQNNVSTVGFNLLAADNTDRFTFQFVGGGQDYVYNRPGRRGRFAVPSVRQQRGHRFAVRRVLQQPASRARTQRPGGGRGRRVWVMARHASPSARLSGHAANAVLEGTVFGPSFFFVTERPG